VICWRSGRPAGLLVAALTVLAGCGPGPRRIGGQPSWRTGEAIAPTVAGSGATLSAPIVFAPASPPARHYNDPPFTAAPSSPLGDAVIEALAAAARELGVDPPLADGRLFAAADEIAEVIPDEGVVPYPLVEFAMQHHGIIEPSPHLLVIWGPLGDPAAIVDQLRPRLAELVTASPRSRLGVGVARGRRPSGSGIVVVALQGTAVTTRPIPRALPDGGVIRLDGEVSAAYRSPEVYLTHEDGTVARPRAVVTGRRFTAEVDCAARRGRLQIEITAIDATGSSVLANFPVWCNEPAPATITVGPSRDDLAPVASEDEAERRMLELVNEDRAAAGLPALAWDERAAEVARAHSREMRATGLVAHVSPTTGSAADRVRAAGIKTAAVLENIARAYGVAEAQAGLMNSPGHRANLMSRAVTHLGVGIVFGDAVAGRREMFVTQVFTRIAPVIDPLRAAERLRGELERVRSLGRDDGLERIARELAAALARGDERKAASARASRQLEQAASRFAKVGSVITTTADLDALDARALIGDASVATHVGIGLAQGTHEDLGEGAVWIVLLLGVAR
jgi:uncharacterized protein YkwD